MSTSQFDLQIKHANDTEEEKQVADAVEGLVNGRADATTAAQIIDKTITNALKKNANDAIAGWQKYVWEKANPQRQ